MIVVQLLANSVLQQLVQPLAMGAALGIHPLAVLIVTIAGGALFGSVGLILAAPSPPPPPASPATSPRPRGEASRPGRSHGMTARADFTEEEWELVLEGPTTAGMLVLMADRGGSIRESFSMAKAYTEARKHHGESELLDEVVSTKPKVDRTRHSSLDELREHGLGELRQAAQLLESKATPEEVDDYRRFVLGLAERVAAAHRGTVRTSASESERPSARSKARSEQEDPMLRRIRDMPSGTLGFEAVGKVEDDDWEDAVEPVLRSEIAEGEKVAPLPPGTRGEGGGRGDDRRHGVPRALCEVVRPRRRGLRRGLDPAGAPALSFLLPGKAKGFPVRELEAAKAWLADDG